MASVPKTVANRFIKEVKKFQNILQKAKDRDINEADTVDIISDILTEVFGFDKYTETTREFAIRNTYCDLAVKIEDDVKYLIEAKAIGLNLKETHLRQTVDYGARQGVNWAILTNGIEWEIYRIRYEKPLQWDKVCSMNFLDLNPRKAENQEKLFLLCKEGLSKAAIEAFHEHRKTVNRFIIGAILLEKPALNLVRREIRKIAPGLRVDNPEIEAIMRNEVLKREVIDGESAKEASSRVKRSTKKKASTPQKAP